MPFISVKLDAKEAILAPEGNFPLRIQSCKEKKTGDKSKIPGEPMLEVMILNEEPDMNYAPVFHTLMIPTPKTDEKNVDMYKLNIQRFLSMFNIAGDEGGFDTDDFAGATCNGFLTQEEGDDKVIRNKLRLDRLDDEPDQAPAKSAGRARGRRGRGGAEEDKEIPF